MRDNFGVVVKDIEVMEDMCVKRWWDMYKRQDLSRLASCRFIGEIKEFILTDKPLGIFSG